MTERISYETTDMFFDIDPETADFIRKGLIPKNGV